MLLVKGRDANSLRRVQFKERKGTWKKYDYSTILKCRICYRWREGNTVGGHFKKWRGGLSCECQSEYGNGIEKVSPILQRGGNSISINASVTLQPMHAVPAQICKREAVDTALWFWRHVTILKPINVAWTSVFQFPLTYSYSVFVSKYIYWINGFSILDLGFDVHDFI